MSSLLITETLAERFSHIKNLSCEESEGIPILKLSMGLLLPLHNAHHRELLTSFGWCSSGLCVTNGTTINVNILQNEKAKPYRKICMMPYWNHGNAAAKPTVGQRKLMV